MECNKDEALKAKEVAELKVIEHDFSGALRFALKAQTLYPELDGLPQLLTTLHVHTSAQKGTTGETDYYKVLRVEPLADRDTIRKQYKRLALSLHPDKNKSVGADGAFQIVKEAWNLLSDKEERFLYDQRRSLRYMVERVSDCKSSAAMSENGFHTFFNYNQLNGKDQWSATYKGPITAMSWNGFHTFFNYNQANGRDQWNATYTDPFTTMSQNGFHTFSNYNQSNGNDQWSATYADPVATTSQNGFHTSSNYNHSNGRDQKSVTRTEPTKVTSQDGFYTSSNYNHSNGRDQRSATPTEPAPPMCQSGSHTSSNYNHSNGRDQMSAELTRVTSQDGFYTSSDYNQSNGRDQRSATPTKPTTPMCQNGFDTSSNYNHSDGRGQSSATLTKPIRRNTKPIRPPSLPKHTFWTACSNCKMQFEYLKTYLNQHLLCHNCRQGFLAAETTAPEVPNLTSSPWISYFQLKGSRQRNRTKKTCAPGSSQIDTINVGLGGNSGVDTSIQNFQAGKTSFESGQVPGSCAGQTASDVRPGFGESKRGHEEAFLNKEAHTWNLDAFKKTDAALASGSPSPASSSVPNKERPKKKRHLSGQEMRMANGGAMKSAFEPNNGSVGTGRFDVGGTHRLHFTRYLPKKQVKSVLQGTAQKEISQKLKVWKEAAASKTSFIPKTATDNNQVKEKQKEEAGSARCKN